jgi:hypothetical protein
MGRFIRICRGINMITKYRAMTLYATENHYVYGFPVKETGGGYSMQIESLNGGLSFVGIDSKTLSRFTEFFDIKNNEVYENDKVSIEYELNKSKGIGIVEMIDGCWSISFRKFPEKPFSPESETFRNQDYLKMFHILPSGTCIAGRMEIIND